MYTRNFILLALATSVAFFTMPVAGQPAADEYFVYVGTYTAATSKGIYGWRFQPSTATLKPLGVMAEAPNPSFLAIRTDHRFLYAVNWKGSDTVPGNTVSAYALDASNGRLSFLNKVSSHGEMPTHLTLDTSGKTLLVANYGSGTVAAIPIGPDGKLGEASAVDQHSGPAVPQHDRLPHAHAVMISPDQRLALVAELGLDRVYAYHLDTSAHTLTPYDPPFVSTAAGSGPRHLALHPNGKFLYTNNETNSTVTVFHFQNTRTILKEIQTISTLPPDFHGRNSTAEIQIDQSGKFLYVSNRGQDSIAVFAVNSSGMLTPVEHVSTQGKTPRNFSLDATGSYLFAANENSGTIVLFRVDRATGRLTPSGKVLDVPNPSCVIFLKRQSP